MTSSPDALALSAEAQDLLFRDARTANAFTDEPVDQETVRAIYDLVKFGPTSMNNQPLRVALVQTAGARERLLKHMAEGNRDKTASAPLVAVLAADTEFHQNLPRVFPPFPQAKEMFADPEAREDVARFNATLQVGYFLLGVRAAGLAAGPMSGFDAPGLDADMFADRSWKCDPDDDLLLESGTAATSERRWFISGRFGRTSGWRPHLPEAWGALVHPRPTRSGFNRPKSPVPRAGRPTDPGTSRSWSSCWSISTRTPSRMSCLSRAGVSGLT